MTRLMMVAAASLLAVALTGCGEKDNNKPVEPAAATTTAAPDAAPAPASAGEEQKPAEQGH